MPPDLSTLSNPAPLNVEDVLINIVLAGILSLLLGWHYKRFGTTFSNRAKLALILPAICLPTVLVISVVKASLALSLGLVGALSIVRFRTPVKEPEELAYIFLAIAVGLGMGAGQRLVTAAAILLILIILTIRSMCLTNSKYPNLYMNIQLATLVAKEQVLKQILDLLTPHVSNVELRRFDKQRAHADPLEPGPDSLCGELRTVIASDVLGHAARDEEPRELFEDVLGIQSPGNVDRQAFARVLERRAPTAEAADRRVFSQTRSRTPRHGHGTAAVNGCTNRH